MKIEAWLAQVILDSKFRVVAITGAADLGKSYIADSLAARLIQGGSSAVTIGFDAYLIERDKRRALGLSGYDPKSHDLESAKSDLIKLLNGESIEYFKYLHKSGKRSESSQIIQPADYIIVEGLHSLHPSLFPMIDYSIFIYTGSNQLRVFRKQSDLEKRGLTLDEAEKHADLEMSEYQKHVAVYKDKASIRLHLKHKWQYQLIA